jgi:hypothetical protein
MNLESSKLPKKNPPDTSIETDLDMDFDFKPITSGLGFHHQKNTTEVKPVIVERAPVMQTASRPISQMNVKPVKADMNVYQNDLSMFYDHGQKQDAEIRAEKMEESIHKGIRLATKSERVFAYFLDLFLVVSVLSLMLMLMARATDMDLLAVWTVYPNEITPLVVSLFVGFYLMYFSIFEKTSSSTLGKGLLGIRVVDLDNNDQRFIVLVLRSTMSLLNFISLGLFSYFDLQNKVTNSKIIRID